MKPERKSGIELLRIYAAMAVVVVHYNYSFAFRIDNLGGAKFALLHLFDSFAIPAVSIFMVITGYFSCFSFDRSVGKIVNLIFQVSFWHTVSYLIGCAQGLTVLSLHGFVSNIIYPDYFVTLYAVVYVFSPYINRMLNTLSLSEFRFLLLLSFGIFSFYAFTIDALYKDFNIDFKIGSPVGITGGQGGCSFVNFCLLYLIGAYIRKAELNISWKKALCGFMACTFLLCCWRWFEVSVGIESTKLTARSYHNPLVLAQALFALQFAKEIVLRSSLINKLAGAAFTCYMTQFIFFQFVDFEFATSQSVGYLFAHIVLCTIGIYLLSYLLYLMYKKTLGHLFHPLIRVMIPYK